MLQSLVAMQWTHSSRSPVGHFFLLMLKIFLDMTPFCSVLAYQNFNMYKLLLSTMSRSEKQKYLTHGISLPIKSKGFAKRTFAFLLHTINKAVECSSS